jgi:hypothetical protein
METSVLKGQKITAIYDEVHEMENLLCGPTKFRHSQLNSDQLNLYKGRICECGNNERVELCGSKTEFSGIT